MYDDSIDNVLHKYLEGVCSRQAEEICHLKADLEGASRFEMRLIKEIDELETAVLALGIQAAESEDRADEEKRKRIALLMRI